MAIQVTRGAESPAGAGLRIGLVNNMGELAFEATERQFVDLLGRAADVVLGGMDVCLSLYTLSGPNGAARAGYRTFEPADEMRLDGLIVTGREPQTADLRDEAYFERFTAVVGWAREHTYSAVWSCLAAHAATLHLDGIRRVRREEKLSGIFACTRVKDHPLVEGLSGCGIPHSRWNGLPEEELCARGYTVLTRAEGLGVDAFLKEFDSLFVFCQGHPEYGTDSLLREYRRDVGRYLRGQSATYPAIPRNYFARETELALEALRGEIEQQASDHSDRTGSRWLERVADVLEQLPIKNTWQDAAAAMYSNWLQYLAARRSAAGQVEAESEDCIVA